MREKMTKKIRKNSFNALLLMLLFGSANASPARKVAQAQLITFEDRVRSVSQEDAFYRITFWRHAAFYAVSKGNPASEKILKALNQSKEKSAAVKLEVDANTLEIQKLVND